MYTYRDLINKIEMLGSMIDVPPELFPDFGRRNDCAHPYVEIKFPFYYLVVSENGKELARQKFQTLDKLLYSVFEKITFEMALRYEVGHRVPTQDFRRILFSYQLELMGKLSPIWEKQLQAKITGILNQNPYNDSTGKY